MTFDIHLSVIDIQNLWLYHVFAKSLAIPCSQDLLPSDRSSAIRKAKRSAAKRCWAAAETPRL